MRGSVATAPVGFFGRSGGGRRLGGLLASFVAASTLIFSGIGPASAETLKWKLGYHLTKVETSEVGDAAGHMVVLARGSGVAFFDGGDVAGATLSITADYVNGAGPHDAYVLHTFDDGSTILVRFQGTTTPDPATKTSAIKGKFTFAKGSGRFAGISGGGDYDGKRLAAAAAAGAELYVDFSGNYSR